MSNSKYFKKIKEHKKIQKLNNDKKYVCNLSNYSLSPADYSVLAKGLKFIPTPKDHIQESINNGIDDLANNIRRTYFFSKRPTFSTFQHPFKQRSTWQAPSAHPQLESYLEDLRKETVKLPITKYSNYNLTLLEKRALTSLSKNRDLIIKKADKGSMIVVEDTDGYLKAGLKHLEDTSIYTELTCDPTEQLSDDIQSFLDNLYNKNFIDEHTYHYLSPHKPTKTQQIYFLKKLHKNPIGIRPIVSGVNGITEKISSYLDHYLQPVVTKGPSYIKNTKELLTILENFSSTSDFIFCTADVSSLYLSIPQEEGLQACLNQLIQHNQLPLPPEIVKQLFNFVLQYNVFRFHNKCFQQIRGTAMGTRMAPAYAGIFMTDLEETFLKSQPLKPQVYKRYIDDILIIWTHSESDLLKFLEALNNVHPTINFTWELSRDKITFLDVDLSKLQQPSGEYGIGYSTHFKATNAFQYVHYSSFHPLSTKKGIVKGEMTRIHRTTSDATARDNTLDFISGKFADRAYPKPLISSCRLDLNRTTTKRTSLPPLLKIPFVLDSHVIKGITKQLWTKHITDPTLAQAFPDPPMIVFTKAKSLFNHLCRSSSPGSVEPGELPLTLPPPHLHSRVHRCNHPLCKCCDQLFDSHNIAGIPLHQHLNCKSKNIVYLLRCKQHSKCIYVGQTTRQLNQRLANHRNTLLNPGHKKSWPLYRHFLNGNHTTEDLVITPLQSARRSDLLQTESTWIRRLNSDRPPGLNSHLPTN